MLNYGDNQMKQQSLSDMYYIVYNTGVVQKSDIYAESLFLSLIKSGAAISIIRSIDSKVMVKSDNAIVWADMDDINNFDNGKGC